MTVTFCSKVFLSESNMQGELQYVDILSGMSDEGLEVS